MTLLPLGTILAAVVLILLIGFLAGYLKGKKEGRFLGFKEAQTELPLILRQKSLETGRCLVCSQPAGFQESLFLLETAEKKVQN